MHMNEPDFMSIMVDIIRGVSNLIIDSVLLLAYDIVNIVGFGLSTLVCESGAASSKPVLVLGCMFVLNLSTKISSSVLEVTSTDESFCMGDVVSKFIITKDP